MVGGWCRQKAPFGKRSGLYAGMAELADAQDSGSCRSNSVQVQVLLPAPNKKKTNTRDDLAFVFSFQASREGPLGSFGLFFVRDYFGLSVKFRIIKGEIFSRPFLYASDFLIISSYRLSILDLLYFLNFISISR